MHLDVYALVGNVLAIHHQPRPCAMIQAAPLSFIPVSSHQWQPSWARIIIRTGIMHDRRQALPIPLNETEASMRPDWAAQCAQTWRLARTMVVDGSGEKKRHKQVRLSRTMMQAAACRMQRKLHQQHRRIYAPVLWGSMMRAAAFSRRTVGS